MIKLLNSYPCVIILSDTHLGATGSKFKLLKEFLSDLLAKIENEPKFSENFQVIILLGDIFDLVCDSYRDITNDYKDIFDLLNKISSKNIRIISLLGNHDISVSGDWDKTFLKRKRRLISNFKKYGLNLECLSEENLCQYIFLKDSKNKWFLYLLDTRNISDENDSRIIEIPKSINEEKNYNAIFIHGHQLFPAETRGAAPIWDFCLNSPDFIREIFNYLWNVALKGQKLDTSINFNKILTDYSKEIYEKFNKKLGLLNRCRLNKFFRKMIKIEQYRESLKNMNIKYRYLFKDTEISHIIFGHTHQVDYQKIEDILLINTGAWHHVNPSYLEFYSDGTFQLKIRNDNGDWINFP